MKCSLRFALSIAFILFLLVWFLGGVIFDLFDQYSTKAYLIDSYNLRFHPELVRPHPNTTPDGKVGDKIIVMAKLEEENADWVETIPDWQRAIYVVNPSQKSREDPKVLTTPANKGHESMAYLSYIIDNYDSLPATIAFLHTHQHAWHVDPPLHDNALAMETLQLDYVQHKGYVNLRCNWNPGCLNAHRINAHVTDEVWHEIFTGTSTPPLNESSLSSSSSPAGTDSMNQAPPQGMRKPKEVGAACCAQFAVSRDQVRKRPREDYIQFRRWVLDTTRNDAKSGRVMEFLWHIIFGQDSVL
ncbi:hypothetical protein FQN50_006529 [Emmonsiellopsis sp. PD_5]|nr:hypothetical protein FQN50_006529 [Emmonsiellopsis sp. PD_5]